MRHGKKNNHLGRTASHRKAMLSNMASSLILHKRINTTIAKAKALRPYIEPLLTKSKDDSTNNRRVVFSYLQNKEVVTELFRTVAPKIANRPGGYTRIIRTGFRVGDNAEMCMIELVDFNEIYTQEAKKTTTRRSRKPATPKAEGTAKETTAKEVVEDVVETPVVEDVVEAPVVEEVVETPVVEETKVEDTAAEDTTDEPSEEDKKEDKE